MSDETVRVDVIIPNKSADHAGYASYVLNHSYGENEPNEAEKKILRYIDSWLQKFSEMEQKFHQEELKHKFCMMALKEMAEHVIELQIRIAELNNNQCTQCTNERYGDYD
jgi:hypothetical protein